MKLFSRAGLVALLTLLLSGCACFQHHGPSNSDPAYLLNYAVKVQVAYTPEPSSGPDAGAPSVTVSVVSSSGSGAVVASSPTRSLILTAEHVCADKAPIGFTQTITVRRVQGAELASRIAWQDKDQDLCILAVEGYAGPAAQLAQELPPLGALVYFPGAPLGLFGDGVGFLEQGHYAGLSSAPIVGARRLLIAGTTTHGASGSGIFYLGHLVGVLLATGEGGYIVVGAELSKVRAVLAAQSLCVEKTGQQKY